MDVHVYTNVKDPKFIGEFDSSLGLPRVGDELVIDDSGARRVERVRWTLGYQGDKPVGYVTLFVSRPIERKQSEGQR